MPSFVVLSCEECDFVHVTNLMPVVGTYEKFVVEEAVFLDAFGDDEEMLDLFCVEFNF